MMISYIILYGMLSWSLLSCGSGGDSSPVVCGDGCHQVDVEFGGKTVFSDILDSVFYVQLETTEESLIGKISKALVADSVIYIMDKRLAERVFAFDMEGKYLFAVGEKGAGPGMYRSVKDICVDRKKGILYVLDGKRYKLLEYSLDGKFIRERVHFKNLGVREVEVYRDGFIVYTGNSCFRNCGSVYITDGQGNISREVLPSDDRLPDHQAVSNNLFALNGEEGLIAPIYRNTIYKYGPEGIRPHVVLNFGDKSMDRERLSRYKDEMKAYIDIAEEMFTHIRCLQSDNSGNLFLTVPLEYALQSGIYNVNRSGKLSMSASNFSRTLDGSFIFEPIGAMGDFIINPIESGRLFKLKTKWMSEEGRNVFDREEVKQVSSPQMRTVLKSVKATDNPVLQFFSMDLSNQRAQETEHGTVGAQGE
ncbi:6-bladed beta-propeller [Echinicola soli]|uniref:6-bladed beta-propeller n=1 Tax=Echinicola soli TaxID=2591634 RepID=A0A514CGU7_9BACT|nr:6-bladed beta-propeller [Echinicola soli]QDH79033.1 6-bladed beta-propeller [Echinicola soli]